MDEIEKVCTDVVILKNGRLIAQSKVGAVLADSRVVMLISDDIRKLKSILQRFDGVKVHRELENAIEVELLRDIETTDINRYCFENGVVLSQLVVMREGLEQQFLEMTK